MARTGAAGIRYPAGSARLDTWAAALGVSSGVAILGLWAWARPNLPEAWNGLKVKISWQGQELLLDITGQQLKVTNLTNTKEIFFLTDGAVHTLKGELALPYGRE